MSAWPAGLPEPELKSFSSTDSFNIIRTDMESGPPRQSLRSSHFMTAGSLSLTLTTAQMDIFQAAIPASNYGADWVTGVPIDSGNGSQPHRIRLIKVSRKVLFPQDGLYKLTITYETDEHN
jgi:hypothetical protein